MIEKIKTYAMWVLGGLAWLLGGWIYLLTSKLRQAQQQAAVDQAKAGIAVALDKVAADQKEAQDADTKFDSLASAYVKPDADK